MSVKLKVGKWLTTSKKVAHVSTVTKYTNTGHVENVFFRWNYDGTCVSREFGDTFDLVEYIGPLDENKHVPLHQEPLVLGDPDRLSWSKSWMPSRRDYFVAAALGALMKTTLSDTRGQVPAYTSYDGKTKAATPQVLAQEAIVYADAVLAAIDTENT